MTQPQHCDYECVCVSYGQDKPLPCNTSSGTKYKCPHDTRARPHTSTPTLPDEVCRICEDCRAKHDAAIRNAIIKELEQSFRGETVTKNGHTSRKELWTQKQIGMKIESLRTPTQEQP